jgi:hypothetical protein
VRGLARWAGTEAFAPADAALKPRPGDLIALAADDLEASDRDCFGLLFAQVKSGALRGLDIHLEGLGDFALSPAAARRFWRRARPVTP